MSEQKDAKEAKVGNREENQNLVLDNLQDF